MLLWRKKTDKGRMTLGKVQKEYRENDVCMGELLDALPADGLSEYQRWRTGRIVR